MPRSLVFRYKGLQADPATVGLALNARTILTGRVVAAGTTLNIQAELVDTATESQLWGEQFRQNAHDLMTVQEEIAWQISEALRLKLTGEQKKKLRKRPTVNPEAYQEYLRGRYHWNNWLAGRLPPRARALRAGHRARPGVRARLCRASATPSARWRTTASSTPADGFPRARAAAQRAIELDPDLADAHVTLALERLFWGWDWDGRRARAADGDRAQSEARARRTPSTALLLSTTRPLRRGGRRTRGSPASSIRCRSSSTWASRGCITSPGVPRTRSARR